MGCFVRGGSVGLVPPEIGTLSPYPSSAWRPGALSELPRIDAPPPALRLKGDFTPLRFIIDLTTPILERAMGFPVGRLRYGYSIVAMADGQDLRPGDIEIELLERSAGVGFDVDDTARLVRLEHGSAAGAGGSVGTGAGAGRQAVPRGRAAIEAIERKLIAALFKEAGNAPAMVLVNPPPGANRHRGESRERFSVPQYTLLADRYFVVVKTMF